MLLQSSSARPAWMERPSRTTLTAKFIVLALVVIAVVYPFLSVLATSLASEQDITEGGSMVLWPAHPSLEAYGTCCSAGAGAHSIWVSWAMPAIGTLLSVTITAMLPYATSRPIMGGRVILMM